MSCKNMDGFMKYQATRVMRDASKQEGELTGQGARFAFSSHILTTI